MRMRRDPTRLGGSEAAQLYEERRMDEECTVMLFRSMALEPEHYLAEKRNPKPRIQNPRTAPRCSDGGTPLYSILLRVRI